MDTSIPAGLPQSITEELIYLNREFEDGLLTEKGYMKKRFLLLQVRPMSNTASTAISPSLASSSIISPSPQYSPQTHMKSNSLESQSLNRTYSGASGMTTSNNSYLQYASQQFQTRTTASNSSNNNGHIRNYSTTSSIQFNQDFNPNIDPVSQPEQQQTVTIASYAPSRDQELQMPLDPRALTLHDKKHANTADSLESLAAILRSRGSTYLRETALAIVDSKGKESTSISWEKLYLKAEKIAQQIRDKTGLYIGDRVCLIYQDVEVVEFTIALFGCFLAGVVAVPISLDWRLSEMIYIMQNTQAHLCLSSETVMKYLDRKMQETEQYKWPKGLEFWRTNDIGTFHLSKKHDLPILQVPDLAYIEFVKSPDGKLNGVAISHKTLMNQMHTLSDILSSNPNFQGKEYKRKDKSFSGGRNVMLNILDSRKSVGLICGVLLNVYTGNLMIWTPASILNTAGLYANIITKFGVTVLLNDYLSLKQVVYNYQSFPQYTRKFSKREVDFSKLKMVLIHTSIVDGEFHEILTNRWLKPLGCKSVENTVSPLLTLSEFGGMVISMRDWIGGEEKLNTKIFNSFDPDSEFFNTEPNNPTTAASAISELLIDRQSLTTNTVKVVSDNPLPSMLENVNKASSQYLRIGSFGYPLPDATLAIVDPETRYLSCVMQVGEIWIDSVSLPGIFWNSNDATKDIFRARCADHEGVLDLEFLRTGLLGFTYNGKVYVLGLYEDRVRQRVQDSSSSAFIEYSYHYLDHIAYSLTRHVSHRRVSDGSAFDILINNEYLPVIVIESPVAVPNGQSGSVDITELDLIATKSFAVLQKYHGIRPYCLLILRPDALPRTIKSGIPGIANMLCKRLFEEGSLRSVYVKYNISEAVREIPRSRYYLDSIWSEFVSASRSQSLAGVVELQSSGLDFRDTAIDERTNKPLTDFSSILEILKWRVKHQPDELAFATISKQNTLKQLSWKKFELKVTGVINLLLDQIRKKKIASQGEMVGLMFTLSDDYIASLYACLILGIVPVPLNAIDPARASEDMPGLISVVKDYQIKTILVNGDVESLVKNKPISTYLKQDTVLASLRFKSVSKLSSKSTIASLELVIAKSPGRKQVSLESAAIVLLSFTDDGKRTGVGYSLKTLSHLCKMLKETCQLQARSPTIACVRHTSGLGFLQSGIIGVYLGCSTYILTPVDFATNPSLFYTSLQRYKVKDVYLTPQMLSYSVRNLKQHRENFTALDKVKNMMIGFDSRPDVELSRNFVTKFAGTKLSLSSMSYTYTHPLSPLVSLRSYLAFEPIDLYLDSNALRLGLISILSPGSDQRYANVIHLQDSGIVPVCTQIAIVNPETREVCKVGEYGEIWVCSEGNSQAIIQSLDDLKLGNAAASNSIQYGAKIKNSTSGLTYIRTGDLGFLHNVSKVDSSTGQHIEFQPLFILGPIANTIESMGLMHFVADVENSIESSHRDIKFGGVCLFKADGFVIAVIDSIRSQYLSSLVPIVFNTVLSKHNLVLDIVAFTKVDGFPYSRLGLKQRAKLINLWNERKLGIRVKYGLNHGERALIEMVQKLESQDQ